jgi:hypothetical protein
MLMQIHVSVSRSVPSFSSAVQRDAVCTTETRRRLCTASPVLASSQKPERERPPLADTGRVWLVLGWYTCKLLRAAGVCFPNTASLPLTEDDGGEGEMLGRARRGPVARGREPESVHVSLVSDPEEQVGGYGYRWRRIPTPYPPSVVFEIGSADCSYCTVLAARYHGPDEDRQRSAGCSLHLGVVFSPLGLGWE